MPIKDKLLVRRTLAGDREAFGDLVEKYGALVHGVIREKIRLADEVEDLVQEVFCRAYEELSKLQEPARFAPWLARISSNVALDWLRRRQVRHSSQYSSQLATLPRISQPDEILEELEDQHILWEALDRLSPEFRQIVVLFHIEECTQSDIARFLGITLPAVRWRLLRARQKLGKELKQALFRKAGKRPDTRRQVRDKILAALPLMPFFLPEPTGGWMGRWRWRLGLTLGLAGTVGIGGVAFRDDLFLDREKSLRSEKSGFRIRRIEMELPEVSVLWEPRQPRAGDRVRIEVAGVEGDQVELHYITDPWNADDQATPMERQGDVLVAEIEVPEEAKVVFFYASAGGGDPQQSLGPSIKRHSSPTDRKILRRYRHSFPMHGADSKPVQNAEVFRAEMARFQGEPLEEILSHLDRELAFYPDHFPAYSTRWRYMLWDGASAGAKEKVRTEQAALIARFPDRPEPLRFAGLWMDDLAYQEGLYGDLYRRFPDSGEAEQAGALMLNRFLFARSYEKLAGAARDFIDRFPKSAEIDMAYWFLLIGLAQVDEREGEELADSLIYGTLDPRVGSGGEMNTSRPPVNVGGLFAKSLAHTLRFEGLVRQGEREAALELARRLTDSGIPDPYPYLYIGRRLANLDVGRLADMINGQEGEKLDYPRDFSLAVEVLERGLPGTEPENALRLPGFILSTRDYSGREETRAWYLQEIAHLRRQFLQALGVCYSFQREYGRAVAYLEEGVRLQEEGPIRARFGEQIYLLLGKAHQMMGNGEKAEAVYLRLLERIYSHSEAEATLERVHRERYGNLEGLSPLLSNCYRDAADLQLRDSHGDPVRLSALKGRVLLIYYITYRVPGADGIFERLEDWAGEFGAHDVEVFYVTGQRTSEEERGERSFRVAVDEDGIKEALNIDFSSLFLIDRRGRLRLRQELRGGKIGAAQELQVTHKIQELIAENGSGSWGIARREGVE